MSSLMDMTYSASQSNAETAKTQAQSMTHLSSRLKEIMDLNFSVTTAAKQQEQTSEGISQHSNQASENINLMSDTVENIKSLIQTLTDANVHMQEQVQHFKD